MADTIEVSLSIKVAWWVRPYIFACAAWSWFGLPFDYDAMVRIVGRGVAPVVK
jgi:hypothetical protein